MTKKQRLKLDEIKVKSFVTQLQGGQDGMLINPGDTVMTDTVMTDTVMHDTDVNPALLGQAGCSWAPTNCGGARLCGSHPTLPGWNCTD